ncbi:O-acetyl-ADP-ribose deacetylase [Euzebya sp.]|uniref:O-acetyl-ADP-ribose deacetylase n=1 Tax=Euzebya sp. TaxID=1971409 RepID=UPI0035167F63
MGTIEIITADITALEVDAIVNAANSSLLGGGGVDGAIHAAGGPAILAECREIAARQGGCPTGQAVVTTAGALRAVCVIHTVGPVYGRDGASAPDLLASCYRNALLQARRRACTSVAFPSISTGVYGYPVPEAAAVAMGVLVEHLRTGQLPTHVVMCCFSDADRATYQAAHDRLVDRAGEPDLIA